MDDNSNNPILDQLPSENEVLQNNNDNNSNEQIQSNYTPPPIYENNNSNIPQEVLHPPQNVPVQYPPPPPPAPRTIYEELNIQNPLSQNNNNITPQSNSNSTETNIYNNQLYVPEEKPNIEQWKCNRHLKSQKNTLNNL